MHVTVRSYLTAGVAALGVGAIALSPVQPISTPDQDRVTRSLAAALAADSTPIDPITPWVDTIETSVANIGALFDFYFSNPGGYTSPLGLEGPGQAVFPLLQTVIANQITYFQELGSGNAGLIPEQIWGNVQTFFNAPWTPGDPAGEYVSATGLTTPLGLSQQTIFALLPTVLGYTPEEWAASPLKPVVDFTATYYSGQLVGLLGPVFAPLIELTRSFTAVGAYFEAGDVTGAINELINIPANVTNAVLNGGGFLDLTGVVNAISPLPPEVKSIGLNLGGVISPPVPQDGSLVDPDNPPTTYNGGVLFDSLAAEISYKISQFPRPDGTSVNVTDPGIPVSWIGAAVGLGQFLSEEMLVTPPPVPTEAASVEAPAEVEAPEVEAPEVEAPEVEAPEVEAPEVEALKTPAAPEAPAAEPAVDDAVAESEAESDAPAPKSAAAVKAPAPSKAAAGSANSGNEKATSASTRGMAKSSAARGAE